MQEKLKQLAAQKAVEKVQNGQVIGVGSGTTVRYFIEALAEKKQAGLKVEVVAASKESEETLKKGGFKIKDLNSVQALDLVVDGADLVDKDKNLIKGGGGALFREKMLFREAKKILVIVDEAKLKPSFSHFSLPVEIVPFGAERTKVRLGFSGSFRKKAGQYYLTDNQNFILDLAIEENMNLKALEEKLKLTLGVVETGLFLGFNPEILAAYSDGSVKAL